MRWGKFTRPDAISSQSGMSSSSQQPTNTFDISSCTSGRTLAYPMRIINSLTAPTAWDDDIPGRSMKKRLMA